LNRSALLICLLIAIGIAVLATSFQGPALWDVKAIDAFQGHGALMLPMRAVTTLGSQGFLVLFVLLVFWCLNKPLGADLALLLVITGAANVTLKTLLQDPRPFWSDPALQLTSGTSFSTPSGHAAHATVVFGYLAWWLVAGRPQDERPQRLLVRGLLAALLLLCAYLVSLSRVYLGVHFPGDVIWGCAEGITVLLVYICLKPYLGVWLRELSVGTHVALAAAAAAAILVLNLLFLPFQQSLPLPAEAGLPHTQARAQAMDEAANLAGLVLGTWIGLVLERRCVRFTTSGPVGRRALRYGLGLAGALAIGLGLPLLFPEEPLTLSMALQVAGAAATALWAVSAWPWLFVRMGLGTAEQTARVAGRTA